MKTAILILLATVMAVTAGDQVVRLGASGVEPLPKFLVLPTGASTTTPQTGDYLACGFKLWDGVVPTPPDADKELLSYVLTQDPGNPQRAVATATWGSVAERQAREAAAAAIVESNRVVQAAWNNAFLMLCDQIAQRDTHVKLSFEELPVYLKALKAANKDLYESARDGLVTLNLALIKKSPHGKDWWDFCEWDSTPAAVALAQQILQGLQ